MSGKSLGLIEAVGLAAAIKAADAALKAANVTLAGYELTKGGGLVTLKMQGDVGAVNAAIAAGAAALKEADQLYSHLIIAHSAEGVESFIQSAETVLTPDLAGKP
ncbi:BMC domain-containing protein [Pantoea sp. CCBC3-3-1]|uniref:BMC domain-containing protein n=1 Tax=Pantoea sp. CCBC3-3-1 TaxID=2490851 RepID=UPI0011BE7A83|nr:BMC domain-containing protein [Pantoea sp. CCBC3-3-1]